MGQADLCSLSEIGDRLRAERRRMGLNQAELGALGNVTLQSQSRYEKANTEAGVLYLARVAAHGLDVSWVLTGARVGSQLSLEASALIDAFNDLHAYDQDAVLRVANALSGRRPPLEQKSLPSPRALTAAFAALLEASPGLDGDDLAHELAKRLPIILRAAEDEIPEPSTEQHDTFPAAPAIRDADRPEVRRERRSR